MSYEEYEYIVNKAAKSKFESECNKLKSDYDELYEERAKVLLENDKLRKQLVEHIKNDVSGEHVSSSTLIKIIELITKK